MRESQKFKVPDALANLYEFANSVDLRRFTHHGVQHTPSDEFTSPPALAKWMAERGLSRSDAKVASPMLEAALQLRSSLRDFLKHDPGERRKDKEILRALNSAIRAFPLVAEAGDGAGMRLRPGRSDALAGLSVIVAELYNASASGALDRLKMCAAEECRRVFFDRSKPASRRWCQSALCGNRMKTRTYRQRHRDGLRTA